MFHFRALEIFVDTVTEIAAIFYEDKPDYFVKLTNSAHFDQIVVRLESEYDEASRELVDNLRVVRNEIQQESYLKEVLDYLTGSPEFEKFDFIVLNDTERIATAILQSTNLGKVGYLAFKELQSMVRDKGPLLPIDLDTRERAMSLYLIATGANRYWESYKNEVERQLRILLSISQNAPINPDSAGDKFNKENSIISLSDLCIDINTPTVLDTILINMRVLTKCDSGKLIAENQDSQTAFVAVYKMMVDLGKMYNHKKYSYKIVRQVFKEHYSIEITEEVIKYSLHKKDNIKFINHLLKAEGLIRAAFPLKSQNWKPGFKTGQN